MTNIRGYVFKKLYINEENGWGIVLFVLEENEKMQIKVKGTVSLLNDKTLYELQGQFVVDPKYGQNFELISYKVAEINSKQQAIKFLSSKIFPTIGPKKAELIVEHFQDDVIKKIRLNPDQLFNIPNLNVESAQIIINTINDMEVDEKLTIEFFENGLRIDILNEIRHLTEDELETENILRNNFYIFCLRKKFSYKFDDIDKIAMHFGVEQYDDQRIGYISYHLTEKILFSTGNTYTFSNTLMKMLANKIECYDNTILIQGLLYAKTNELLFFKDQKIYSRDSWNDEVSIVNEVKKMAAKSQTSINSINSIIQEVEREVGIEINNDEFEYSFEQKQALELFINTGLMILTGGPGTGKTTVIRGIVKVWHKIRAEEAENRIAIAAPTGRAAFRIRETTNYKLDATTIHRLLKYTKNGEFNVNFDNPLMERLIIIDECSMIDNHLFAKLLEASNQAVKIVLVGDVDQLPSVSYGNVFSDLVECQKIPTIKLTQIKRQSQNSGIIQLANAIINDEIDSLDLSGLNNVKTIFSIDNNDQAMQSINVLYEEYLLKNQELDLQIISPMYGNNLGVEQINIDIQANHNPNITNLKKVVEFGKNRYTINDRVMYLENDPDLDLANGDIGIVEDVVYLNDKFQTIVINFANKVLGLTKQHLEKLTLSYACTVHKTQGSEYKNVIMVLDKNNKSSFFLNKKIIYTAITRAKDQIFLIGDYELFIQACLKPAPIRNTTLKEKIIESWK